MSLQDKNDSNLSEKEKLLAEIKGYYNGDESTSATTSGTPSDNTSANTGDNSIPEDISDEELEAAVSPTPVVMQVAEPLPKYGSGFKFVPIISVITVIAVVLGHIPPITSGIPTAAWLRYTYIGFGVIFLFFGIKLIVDAVSTCSINENLQMGKLVTTGIYSRTRNPIYAGVIIICTAALFFSGNAFMYFLPIVYYFILSGLMKATEEPFLEERFGATYRDYRTSTYMFVPFKKN